MGPGRIRDASVPDWDAFLAAIQAIYGAAANPSEWPDALTAVARVFGGVGSVLLFRREDQSIGTVVSPTLEAAQRAYDEGWWREDIFVIRVAERSFQRESDVVASHHLLSPEERTTHPFVTDFLVPHGLGHLAAAGMAPARESTVFMSTHRFIKDRPFDEDELRLFAHIGRHVENALRLGIRLITAEMATLALGDALAGLGVGVFLVDAQGHVVFRNARGEALLGDPFILKGGRLGARSNRVAKTFDDTLDAAINSMPIVARALPRPIILHGADTDDFVAAYVQPMPRDDAVALLFSDVRAAVVAMSSKVTEVPDPTLIRDLLGVTLSEARLAGFIGGGVPPRQAAEQLGITEQTARTALKRIFAKTGIARQSQLAGLLGRLVLR